MNASAAAALVPATPRGRLLGIAAAIAAFAFWRFAIDALLSASLTFAAVSCGVVALVSRRPHGRVVVANVVVLIVLASLGGR